MPMTFYRRLADYLSQYAEAGNAPIPADPVYIRDALSLLVSEGKKTKEQLCSEALEQNDVIIPESYFLKG